MARVSRGAQLMGDLKLCTDLGGDERRQRTAGDVAHLGETCDGSISTGSSQLMRFRGAETYRARCAADGGDVLSCGVERLCAGEDRERKREGASSSVDCLHSSTP